MQKSFLIGLIIFKLYLKQAADRKEIAQPAEIEKILLFQNFPPRQLKMPRITRARSKRDFIFIPLKLMSLLRTKTFWLII